MAIGICSWWPPFRRARPARVQDSQVRSTRLSPVAHHPGVLRSGSVCGAWGPAPVVSLWEVACRRFDRCSMQCRTLGSGWEGTLKPGEDAGSETRTRGEPMLYWRLMPSARFRTGARVAAWFLLALVALDLGNPSLCALDQESQPKPVSAATNLESRSPEGTPTSPAHVDDCFCCSHCVDVAAVMAPATLSLALNNVPLPADRLPFSAAYPPYHPPKV